MEQSTKKNMHIFLVSSIAFSLVLIIILLTMSIVKNFYDNKFPDNIVRVSYNIGDATNKSIFKTKDYEIGYALEDFIDFPIVCNKFFEGWYLDEAMQTKANFPIKLDKDCTLYANYLEGNLPKQNIAYDSSLDEYYVTGTLSKNFFGTLIIPDAYDDGIHGVKNLTNIINVSNNISLLTDNKNIETLYIGNNISTITEYFAYNSTNITKLVIGKMVTNIAGNAFGECKSLEETSSGNSSSGWFDLSSNDLVNAEVQWLAGKWFVFRFDTTNIDSTYNHATYGKKATNDADFQYSIKVEPKTGQILFTATKEELGLYYEDGTYKFPTTVNYRFECWCTDVDRTMPFEYGTTVVTKNITLYARYQLGNVPNLKEDTTDESNPFYYIPKNVLSTNSSYAPNYLPSTTTQYIVPDIYEYAGNAEGFLKVTRMEDNTSSSYGPLNKRSAIEEIYIGNYVENITGYFAYANSSVGSTSLKTLVLPDACLEIGVSAFRNCSYIANFEWLGNFKTIGNYAFNKCGITHDLYLNGTSSTGVTIGSNAFHTCSSLTSVELKNIDTIGERAFYDCNYLTSAKIENVITLEASVFSDCGRLENLDLKNIVKVSNSVFSTCTALKVCKFPEGLTSIGNSCFSGCSALEDVTIPSTVNSIGNSAFKSLRNLKILNYGAENCTSLGNEAFFDLGSNSQYTQLNFLKTVRIIPSYFLSSEDTSLGTGMSYVGSYISTINFEEGSQLESIGNYAFSGLMQENSEIIQNSTFSLPDSLETIGTDTLNCHAWGFCYGNIKLPSNLKTIGDRAFMSFVNLKTITIPEKVQSIGVTTLAPFVDSITVMEGNTVFDSRNNCNAIIETSTNKLIEGCNNSTVPEGVEIIGSYAFQGCNFEDITLPQSLKAIKVYAFSACSSLKSLIIPENVTSIDCYAFLWCDALETLTFSDPNKWWRTTSSTATSGTSVSLGTPKNNVKLFTDTYCNYYFRKST